MKKILVLILLCPYLLCADSVSNGTNGFKTGLVSGVQSTILNVTVNQGEAFGGKFSYCLQGANVSGVAILCGEFSFILINNTGTIQHLESTPSELTKPNGVLSIVWAASQSGNDLVIKATPTVNGFTANVLAIYWRVSTPKDSDSQAPLPR